MQAQYQEQIEQAQFTAKIQAQKFQNMMANFQGGAFNLLAAGPSQQGPSTT